MNYSILIICLSLFTLNLRAEERTSKELIHQIAKECEVPEIVLEAVCSVESNFRCNVLNVGGKSISFESKDLAIKFLKKLIQHGVTNVDVGCMQINVRWHGNNIQSPEQLFDEKTALRYGAKLLKTLSLEKGGWLQGILFYHSGDPKAQSRYLEKIKRALVTQTENT